jgi:hypothetical protein
MPVQNVFEGQPDTRAPHSHIPDVVVEITDRASNVHDVTEWANKGIRIISGSEAFRSYDWLKGVPKVNSVGNLRGMVINQNPRIVWNFSSNMGQKLEKSGAILRYAGILVELGKQFNRAVETASSSEPWDVKSSKLSLMFSMAVFRAVTGGVPLGAHLIALSLEGYLGIADIVSGGRFKQLPKQTENLRALDSTVTSTYNQIYSDEYAYHFINTYLVVPL